MGKREKKTGKGRLDKWYQLAKEQGYRARSAFKLIQLNRKYDFLSSARCVIDLCAAPGGWLQVAAKHMPQNSIIVGVDLVAIKPIPRCVTLVEDITTEKCRRSIRAEVKDWKADVVLHDGAPNVGSAWVQDAFSQVELVLSSLKLATEFLAPGGTFVTKVFRSKDYNSLLWVFNQLFTKVEATKPPSSRNVSAEIFVVCSGYLAPAKIDPKLLSAKHVFSDVDTAPAGNPLTDTISTKDKLTPATLNVFHPEKKRRQRDGYEDGDMTLYKECGMMEFIRSVDPIGVLGMVGRIRWLEEEDKKLYKSPFTSADVKASVEDLRVLGKKDFKNLLKYRIAIREDLGIDVKVKAAEEFTEKADVEPLDEEEEIEQELDRLAKEDAFRRRRERRKLNERKTRNIQRMQLNMVTPMDIGLERQDGIDDADMFDLGEVEGKRKRGSGRAMQGDFGTAAEEEESGSDGSDESGLDVLEEEDDEEDDGLDDEERKTRRLEASLDQLYDQFHARKTERDAKHKAKEEKRKRDAAEGGEWHGIKAVESEEDDSGDNDPAPAPDSDDEDTDEGMEEDEGAEGMDVDDGIEQDENADDSTVSAVAPRLSKRAAKAAATTKARQDRKAASSLLTTLVAPVAEEKRAGEKSKAAKQWFDQPVFKGLKGLEEMMRGDAPEEEDVDEDEEAADVSGVWEQMGSEDEAAEAAALTAYAERDSDEEDSDDDFSGAVETHVENPEMAAEADFKGQEDEEEARRERIDKLGLTTAQAMTLAQQLVNRERTKTQLIDEGFNRHAFNTGGDGLPSWFLDDESKSFRNNIPVTKEAVAAIREKLRALNARPIKKIAEAKARKKMRTIRRIEKTRAKTAAINDDEDNGLTEKEKASSIAKVLSKSSGSAKPKKEEVTLVVARGSNKGNTGRPAGVKGRFRKVDARMKKEVRAMKRIKKRDRKSSGRVKMNK